MPGRTQRIETRSQAVQPAALPSRLGKYEILEPIGEGGFGIVFKGFDPFIKRHVAIKTCTSPDRELRQRYYREAEIAGRLDHPNIVRIFDFGTEAETPYLVQEFLGGSDLDEKTAGHDFIPFPERLFYLIQVARGLAYAHARDVVHRDIKPANIRILDDGTAKIMDFGVAMLLDTDSRMTQEGMAVGTAAYLAPEQVRGETADARTDVFSFGILAYELLSGERPFERDTISATLYAIINDDPKPIALPSHACPGALRALIERCLEKDPERRFSGFDEIVERLDRIRVEMRSTDHPRDYDEELRQVIASTSPRHERDDRPTADRPPPGEARLAHPTLPAAVRMQRRSTWQSARRPLLVLVTLALLYALLPIAGVPRWPTDREPADGLEDRSPTGPEAVPSVSLTAPDTLPREAAGLEGAERNDSAERRQQQGDAEESLAAAESLPTEEPSPAPPAPEKATLRLAAGWHRDITASIDGGAAMVLDRNRSRQLDPGTYSVRFRLETSDYRDVRTVQVELAEGEEKLLANPIGRPGRLSVQASLGSPQGVVHLDGATVGTSPLRSLKLPPGRHRLEVFAIDHPTIALAESSVRIDSNRETVVTFDLTGQRELAVRSRATASPEGSE